ncbi:MAG: metal-dependent hydrolase [Candidatus Methanofastidiosia archaeon]
MEIERLFLLFVIIFSYIPDINIHTRLHRKIFHNLFFVFISSILASYVVSIWLPEEFTFIPKFPILLIFGASLYGTLSHVFLDYFSKGGVWILWTLSNEPTCQGGFLGRGVSNKSSWADVYTIVLIIY